MAKKAKPKEAEDWKLNQTQAEHARMGQLAWKHLQEGKGDSWPLWADMCPILKDCRDRAMKEIGLTAKDPTPQKDGKYNAAMTRNLKAVKLDEVPKMARKACIDAAPHLRAINKYREELRVSEDSKERWKYLNQQSPQAVWKEYATYADLLPEKEPKDPKFADTVVKKVLAEENHYVASGLASLMSPNRLHALAVDMLERLPVKRRSAPEDTIDIPRAASHDAVLHLIEKLKWDTSEKSRLADALGFGAGDDSQKTIEALREENEALKARPPGDTEQVASLQQELEAERAQATTLAEQLAKASTPATDADKELERLKTLVIPQLEAKLAAALAEQPTGGDSEQARHLMDQYQESQNDLREAKAEAETAKATVAELTKEQSRRNLRVDALVGERDKVLAERDALTVEIAALRTQLAAMQPAPKGNGQVKGSGQVVDGEGGE